MHLSVTASPAPRRAWENLQGVLQMLVDLHYCGLVTASVTVVGSFQYVSHATLAERPQCVNLPENMVTTFRSCDQL